MRQDAIRNDLSCTPIFHRFRTDGKNGNMPLMNSSMRVETGSDMKRSIIIIIFFFKEAKAVQNEAVDTTIESRV